MTTDAFDDLKKHFKAMAIELKSKGEQASVFAHTSDTGTEREEAYRTFLERHLPKTCDVFLGGYLFDMNGAKSSQMDVIVTDGHTPRFVMPDGSKHIAPLEGSVGVAEIKSKLDKDSLLRTLEGCASIPGMPDKSGLANPMLKLHDEGWLDTPYKVIFAYDGVAADTLLDHLNSFYLEHSDITLDRRPNVIHVLGKYMIIRVVSGISFQTIDGAPSDDSLSIGQFEALTVQPDVSAMLWIINALHKKASTASHLLYKFDAWHENIVMRLVAEPA
ncbi:MAG: hypothetical protein OXG34_02960 [bacterium]|nr:hypothetical protein [bacterium]